MLASARRIIAYAFKLFILDFVYLSDSTLEREGFIFLMGNSHLGDVFSFSSLLRNLSQTSAAKIRIVMRKEHAFILNTFPSKAYFQKTDSIPFEFTGHVRVIFYDQKHIFITSVWNFLYIVRLMVLIILLPFLWKTTISVKAPNNLISHFFYESVLPFTRAPLKFADPDSEGIQGNKEVEEFVHGIGAMPGNTVLIAPESNSGFSLTKNEIASIVESVTKAGLNYIINTTSKVYDSYKQTRIPLSIIIPIVNRFGYFISVRSGLCDMVSVSNAKLIVIYRRKQLWHYDLDKEIRFSSGVVQVIKDMEDPDDELRNRINEYLIKDI